MVVESSPIRVVPDANDVNRSPMSTPKSLKSMWGTVTSGPRVHWQWFRNSHAEWKDYTNEEKQKIETAFQKGATCVRLNAGNGNAEKGHLKELFLTDMVQYNPITGKTKEIRRIGPDGIWNKIARWTRGHLESVSKGTVRHRSFIKYKKVLTGEKKVKEIKYKPPRSEFCSLIVQSGLFTVVQMAAIILNTIFIGFDVEHNGPDASEQTQAVFQVFNHAFCVFFTVEIIIRFGAMRKRKSLQKVIRKTLMDRWFCFDLILVFLMILETWMMPLFFAGGAGLETSNMSSLRLMRLMRLSRVGRVGRLLKVFPEILMMLKSIAAASRAVFCTLGMLVVMLYVFAIVFKAQSENSPLRDTFPTIPATMWKLLIHGAFMDEIAITVNEIGAEDSGLATLFMAFVLLSNLIVLNMLIGVICDVAKGVSETEKEKMSTKALAADLGEFLDCFDMDSDQKISMQEFELLIGNPDVKGMLERHQVDVHTLEALKVSLFSDQDAQNAAKSAKHESDDVGSTEELEVQWKQLSYEEFIETILRFRGGAGMNATLLDVINCERNLRSQIQQLEKLTVQSKFMKAFGTSSRSTASQKIPPKIYSAPAAVVKKEDDQADIPPESTSPALAKSIQVFKGNSVPESKLMAESDTDKQHSGKEGNGPNIQEERPVHESKSGIESIVNAKEISNSSKVLEQQHDNLLTMENLLTMVKEELAQQQSTFKAFMIEAIHDQMKSLEVGQCEIIGQLARNSSTSQNQAADDKIPWSAEHSNLFLKGIHQQMKSLEVGQREMLGQLARNNTRETQNEVTDSKCLLLADQSQAASQDAIVGTSDITASDRPLTKSDSDLVT